MRVETIKHLNRWDLFKINKEKAIIKYCEASKARYKRIACAKKYSCFLTYKKVWRGILALIKEERYQRLYREKGMFAFIKVTTKLRRGLNR